MNNTCYVNNKEQISNQVPISLQLFEYFTTFRDCFGRIVQFSQSNCSVQMLKHRKTLKKLQLSLHFQVRSGSPSSSTSSSAAAAFLYSGNSGGSDPLGSPPPAHMGGIPYSLDPSKGISNEKATLIVSPFFFLFPLSLEYYGLGMLICFKIDLM